MWVSRDRINWTILGGEWYPENKGVSVFAANSDTLKMNETHMQVSEGYKIPVQKAKPTSRVINVSGLVIANSAEETRDRRKEISDLVLGDNVYFYDEIEKKVFSGYVPNINITNNRGKYNGRTLLFNFNVTMLTPFYEDMEETIVNFAGGDYCEFDSESEETEYTLIVKQLFDISYVPVYFTSVLDGYIEFTEQISLLDGNEYLYISTRNSEYKVEKINTDGTKTNLLGKIKDSFFTDMSQLTKGINSFNIGSGLKRKADISFCYYKRSL